VAHAAEDCSARALWLRVTKEARMRTWSMFVLALAFVLLAEEASAFAQQRTFTFVNRCPETVWVGSLGNPGHVPPNRGGWAVAAGASSSVSIPAAWAGRFWGRRNCHFDQNGNGTCDTGDCGGRLQCNGAGGRPPTTLAEFTLNGGGNTDYYDVSLVDGYDFPIEIRPSPATTVPGNPFQCGAPTCRSDLLASCPNELKKRNAAGQVIACMSACEAFNTDQYCCRGAFNTPQTCKSSNWPVNYPAIFKNACPSQYSYAYDDQSSTFTCNNPYPNYTITFCAVGGGLPPPTTQPIDPNAWYNIINENSGKCVDDAEWGTVNGSIVQQYGCGNHQANQQWRLQPTSDGYYRIISRHAPSLVLDVAGGPNATNAGVKVHLWGDHGGTNQQWKPVDLGGGYYKLVARHSGKCLDVPWASIEQGVQLQQADCSGNPAQSFLLVRQ
jgi:Thaumatin family/Ricin-type beta-trefoil lectin domain-like